MSNRAGGNSRASKYDYLIKLLLIGDSGEQSVRSEIIFSHAVLVLFRGRQILFAVEILR